MRQLIILAVFFGLVAISAPKAAVASVGAAKQCSKLQDQVSKRSTALQNAKNSNSGPKKEKLIRRATAALASAEVKYKRICAVPVCAQPPMGKCAGQVCIQVMPEAKTYPSLAEAREAGAKLLYYGAC